MSLTATYSDYERFSKALLKDLISQYGAVKAKKLFKPLNRRQFVKFVREAQSHPLKARWLQRIAAGYDADFDVPVKAA